MVWTSETGICDVAIELRICPANWKTARGRAPRRTLYDGARRPSFRAGMAVFREGNIEARYERIKHHVETNPNWTIVRVMGLGRAVKIDFEEVFVSADVIYQRTQRP